MVNPNETTNQALGRLGYRRVDHERGGELCRRLREVARQTGALQSCHGRHVERVRDGEPVWELGCSAAVERANEWIERQEEVASGVVDLVRRLNQEALRG